MKRFIVITVLVGVLCCVVSGTVVGSTMDEADEMGLLPEVQFAVTNLNLQSAGKHPVFEIQLLGTVIYYNLNAPQWPNEVFVVTAFGEYNYDTGIATEHIYATILKAEVQADYMQDDKKYTDVVLQCSQNPWVHGTRLGAQGCQVTETKKAISKPGIVTPYEFPLSSFFMPDQMRALLVEWEENKLSEPELSDWNPYAPDVSTDKLTIVSPAPYEVIPANAASFQLALHTTLTPPPQTIEMKWNRMEDTGGWVGDIKVPGTGKLWQPFAGPATASWSEFPLTIPVSPDFTSSEPMLYQVSVRGVGETTWTPWCQFWIGDPPVNYSGTKSLVRSTTKNTQYVYDTFLKFALKQEKKLSKLEKAKTPIAEKLTAPEIILPDQHQVFEVAKTPIQIQVKAQHDSDYNVKFEFERSPSGMPGYKKVSVQSKKLGSPKGTTAIQFSTADTGKWRVRAKLDTSGATWSQWREFNVNKVEPPSPPRPR